MKTKNYVRINMKELITSEHAPAAITLIRTALLTET